MRAGGVGGALVILWLLTLGVHAQPGLLYLNEEPLSVDPEPIWNGSAWLVPVEAFALSIGLEVEIQEDAVLVRGPGFRQSIELPASERIDEVLYTPPTRLLELISGRARWIGSSLYLSTSPAVVTAVDVSSSHVTVRLSNFTSRVGTWSHSDQQSTLRIRWPHSTLDGQAKQIRVGSSGIQEVLVLPTQQGVEVILRCEPNLQFGVEEMEGDPSYAWTLRIAEAPYQRAAVHVTQGVTAHEWTLEEFGCTMRFVYAETWRDSYRLQPIVSLVAYPQPQAMESLLTGAGARAAVSMGGGSACPARSLIIEGTPYATSDIPDRVLAVDAFGRWRLISSPSAACLQHGGDCIPLDGVNRPLMYGEIVAYAPGYAEAIAPEVTGEFLVVKSRDGRVISIYRGPFVSRDASTTLVVASGPSAERLLGIQLGDTVQLHGHLLLARETLPHVCSSGPLVLSGGSADEPEEQDAAPGDLLSATVLACDWQGGLYLLTVDRVSPTPTPALLDLLRRLPTMIRDAVVLSSCAPTSLAYASSRGPIRLGSANPVTVSLGLIPLHP